MILRFFFCAALAITALWLGICGTYVNAGIGWSNVVDMPPSDMAYFLSAIFSPLVLMWATIGFTYYAGIIQKQGIILQKMMFYIKDSSDKIACSANDMHYMETALTELNNVVADIAVRACLLRQSAVEVLWHRVHEGDKWAFCNAILENAQDIKDFDFVIAKQSVKNKKLALSVNIFCDRVSGLLDYLNQNAVMKPYASLLEASSLGVLYARLVKINGIKGEIKPSEIEEADDLTVTEIPIFTVAATKQDEPAVSSQVILETIEDETAVKPASDYNWEEKKKELMSHYKEAKVNETSDEV